MFSEVIGPSETLGLRMMTNAIDSRAEVPMKQHLPTYYRELYICTAEIPLFIILLESSLLPKGLVDVKASKTVKKKRTFPNRVITACLPNLV